MNIVVELDELKRLEFDYIVKIFRFVLGFIYVFLILGVLYFLRKRRIFLVLVFFFRIILIFRCMLR